MFTNKGISGFLKLLKSIIKNEKIKLTKNVFQKYIRDSVRALKKFYSSIETAHDFALIAEIRRDNKKYIL